MQPWAPLPTSLPRGGKRPKRYSCISFTPSKMSVAFTPSSLQASTELMLWPSVFLGTCSVAPSSQGPAPRAGSGHAPLSFAQPLSCFHLEADASALSGGQALTDRGLGVLVSEPQLLPCSLLMSRWSPVAWVVCWARPQRQQNL